MRPLTLVFGLLAVLMLGASFWVWLHAGGIAQEWPLYGFLDASPIPKLVMVVILIFCLPTVLVVGLVHLAGRSQGTSSVLTLLAWLMSGFGLLGTLYGCLSIGVAMKATHTTNFMVIAPGLSEALLPLGSALAVATLAMLLNRPPRAAAPA